MSFCWPVIARLDAACADNASRTFHSIDKCSLFGQTDIDGYVCQAAEPGGPSPSEILSNYMGKEVHLVMKGPRVRPCDPTPLFPNLEASSVFQVRPYVSAIANFAIG